MLPVCFFRLLLASSNPLTCPRSPFIHCRPCHLPFLLILLPLPSRHPRVTPPLSPRRFLTSFFLLREPGCSVGPPLHTVPDAPSPVFCLPPHRRQFFPLAPTSQYHLPLSFRFSTARTPFSYAVASGHYRVLRLLSCVKPLHVGFFTPTPSFLGFNNMALSLRFAALLSPRTPLPPSLRVHLHLVTHSLHLLLQSATPSLSPLLSSRKSADPTPRLRLLLSCPTSRSGHVSVVFHATATYFSHLRPSTLAFRYFEHSSHDHPLLSIFPLVATHASPFILVLSSVIAALTARLPFLALLCHASTHQSFRFRHFLLALSVLHSPVLLIPSSVVIRAVSPPPGLAVCPCASHY